MRSTKKWWRFVGAAAVASTILCAGGFGYAVKELVNPQAAAPGPAKEEEPAAGDAAGTDAGWRDKQELRIVALGDSLTAGTGDLSGRGYVGQLREKLQERLGKPVYLHNNFAIPGYRTYDLLKDWDEKKDIGLSLREADIVLLTIGGNDLFEGGQDIFSADAGDGFDPLAAADRLEEAGERLQQIFDRAAKAAPQAQIVYIGLYHPFLDLDPEREGAPIIHEWNAAAVLKANEYPNITVVPTYDLFELNLNNYLYSDHFHPNQEGYERIAERIAVILD